MRPAPGRMAERAARDAVRLRIDALEAEVLDASIGVGELETEEREARETWIRTQERRMDLAEKLREKIAELAMLRGPASHGRGAR